MVVAIVAYFTLQLVVAYWVSRWIHSEADYFVAGRGLGAWVAAGSLFATWFGAETVMGSSGAVAEEGLAGSRADPFGYTICLILLAFLLAYRLRAGGYVTLADFFRLRFSRIVEILAVVIITPTSIIWAAAQISALGQILVVIAGTSLGVGLVVATLAIILYTLLGGMWGDVITDLIQGAVIVVGLAILLAFVFAKAGGLGAGLAMIEPSQLSFVGPDETFLERFDTWMIPILGSLVAFESTSRLLSTRSPATARNAAYLASGIYLVVGVIPVMIALVGSHLPLSLGHQDEFLPSLAKATLPPVLYAVLVGALVSAIVSTINSTLLAVSAAVSHNVVVPFFAGITEARKVLLARFFVVLAGLSACGVALSGESIYDLVNLASSLGSGGVLVTVVFGMFLRTGRVPSALAALLAGAATNLATSTILPVEAPFLLSVAVAAAAYIAAAPLSTMPKPAPGAG